MKRCILLICLLGVFPMYAQEIRITWGRHGGCTGRGICTIDTQTERALNFNETIAEFTLSKEGALVLRIDKYLTPSQNIDYILEQQIEYKDTQLILPVMEEVPFNIELIALIENSTSKQLSKIFTAYYRVEISEAFIDIILIEE